MILPMTTSIGWADHGGSRHAPWGLTVPPSSTGNYSVSWTTSLTVQLQEKVGGGAYNTIYSGNASPQSFTNKPPGTYTYRLYRSFYSQRRGLIERYSAPVTTVVFAPLPPDPSNQGFRGEYRAYSGDLNGDGYADLVVSRFNGESGPVAPDNFALMQNLNQTFWIDDTLTPTQVNIAQSWPESSVSLIQRDINVDGRFDFLVKGLSQDSNFASSTVDQIVFAPNTSPIHLRPADAEFLQFMGDTYGWMTNQNYFENTAIANGWYEFQGEEQTGWWYISYINTYYSYGNGNSFLAVDDDPNDPNNLPAFCENYPWLCWFNPWAGSWLVYGTFLANIQVVIDYTNFNQEARQFAAAAGDAFHDQDAAATGNSDPAEQILEDMLEVQIGDILAEVMADPMPMPELPSGEQIPQPRDTPWGDGDPANDPDFSKETEQRRVWVWRVFGKIGIVLCGLLTCPSEVDPDEDLQVEWQHFGWEWALFDLAKNEIDPDNEQPKIVIGEAEGGSVYQRIPAAALEYGAIFYNPGMFSSQPESPENAKFMWAMNQSWVDFWRHLQSHFYDIGLYNGRIGPRGIFYPCERVELEGYPHRSEEWRFDTENFNYGNCQFLPPWN